MTIKSFWKTYDLLCPDIEREDKLRGGEDHQATLSSHESLAQVLQQLARLQVYRLIIDGGSVFGSLYASSSIPSRLSQRRSTSLPAIPLSLPKAQRKGLLRSRQFMSELDEFLTRAMVLHPDLRVDVVFDHPLRRAGLKEATNKTRMAKNSSYESMKIIFPPERGAQTFWLTHSAPPSPVTSPPSLHWSATHPGPSSSSSTPSTSSSENTIQVSCHPSGKIRFIIANDEADTFISSGHCSLSPFGPSNSESTAVWSRDGDLVLLTSSEIARYRVIQRRKRTEKESKEGRPQENEDEYHDDDDDDDNGSEDEDDWNPTTTRPKEWTIIDTSRFIPRFFQDLPASTSDIVLMACITGCDYCVGLSGYGFITLRRLARANPHILQQDWWANESEDQIYSVFYPSGVVGADEPAGGKEAVESQKSRIRAVKGDLARIKNLILSDEAQWYLKSWTRDAARRTIVWPENSPTIVKPYPPRARTTPLIGNQART